MAFSRGIFGATAILSAPYPSYRDSFISNVGNRTRDLSTESRDTDTERPNPRTYRDSRLDTDERWDQSVCVP